MRTRGFIITMIAVALTVALQMTISTATAASGTYSAQLISPRAGQVLYPGQQFRVEWTAVLPPVNMQTCEEEIWLSLDGGKTFTIRITPSLDPKARFFYWSVPNTPTNAAVLDIRFGCEWWYPESYAPQPASTFAIAKTGPG